MKKPVVLLRTLPGQDAEEIKAIEKHFPILDSRLDIKPNDLVIGRYSVLPFYEEQHRDILSVGARLINSYKQHRYIANLMNWYEDLKGLTPETWPSLEAAPGDGPFILKGATNSRKFQWDTHMFAATRRDASLVCTELQNDSLIGYQDIVVRRYVPLKTYYTSFHGLPITKEFRFFVCAGEILSGGYYWASHTEDLKDLHNIVPDWEEVPTSLIDAVISRVGEKAFFYAVDVAQTEAGDWIVIELNDGQMSGLSDNDPEELYKNLSFVLTNFS
jgi:hypothetical protein